MLDPDDAPEGVGPAGDGIELAPRRSGGFATNRKGGWSGSGGFQAVFQVAVLSLAAACSADRSTEPSAVDPGPPSLAVTRDFPWGRQMDALHGVPIYSNYNSVTGKLEGMYQCVEFVRRYMTSRYSVNLPAVVGAADFWTKTMPRALRRVANGGVELPHVGDMVVMTGGTQGFGHVGIVANPSSSVVKIAQQNTWNSRADLMVSTSQLAGTKRYSVPALSGYTTLGWYTTSPLPVMTPVITSFAPGTPTRSTSLQTFAISTQQVGEEATQVTLRDPRGNTIIGAAVKLTPGGITFRSVLPTAGRWSVEVRVGTRTSNRYSFTVL